MKVSGDEDSVLFCSVFSKSTTLHASGLRVEG